MNTFPLVAAVALSEMHTAILTWLIEYILKDSQDLFVWESLESQAYMKILVKRS